MRVGLQRIVYAGALAATGAIGCSLILSAADKPCATDGDCGRFGVGAACVSGFCALPTVPDSGEDAMTPPECTSNRDASIKSQDLLAVCANGKIVKITPAVCPFAPTDRRVYQVDNAIIVPVILPLSSETGSGNPLPALNDTPPYWLTRAAADQITNAIGGVLAGEPGVPVKRPVFPIFCRGETDAYVEQSAALLIDRAKFPLVIVSVTSAQLDTIVWAQHAALVPAADRPLIVNAYLGDARTETIASDGLLWHVGGSTIDVADAVAPMITRTQQFLASRRDGAAGSGKVALIHRADAENERTAGKIRQLWSVPTGSQLVQAVPTRMIGEADTAYNARIDSAVVSAVQAFNPEVIVAVEPNVAAVARLEQQLPTPKPTFLLVGEVALDSEFVKSIGSPLAGELPASRRQRFFGIYPESDAEPIAARLRTEAYDKAASIRSLEKPDAGAFRREYENFFDAFNFAYYALVNARLSANGAFKGSVVRDAIPGLLVDNGRMGQHYPDAGPGRVLFSVELQTIDDQSRDMFSLMPDSVGRITGTMGVYRFSATRARQASVAVSCVALRTEPLGGAPCGDDACSKYDQLRLVRGTPPSLSGAVTCFSGF